MRANRKTVAIAFATLEAGGIRLPESYRSDRGWEFALDLWTGLLADLEEEELLAATAAYLRSPGVAFWPTPGKLLELVPGNRAFDDADATWGEVLELASKKGRANPPIPARDLQAEPPDSKRWALDPEEYQRDDALRVAVSAVGGWRNLCLMDLSQTAAARASFREAYRGALGSGRHRETITTARNLLLEGKVLQLTERGKG